ncbi:MAG TPA: MEDS domain-containing protein [Pyrinomonadaceae bacterium]
MTTELRKTGISVVGDIPWGTHFCHFYETKEDLLDILIPYFKAGLENNEFCVWVVADPLGEEGARDALRRAIPDADRYLGAGHIEIVPHTSFPASRQQASPAGSIEIVPHTEWYLKSGAFVAERIINGLNEKLAAALANGYAGLRVNCVDAWLEVNRKDFIQFEKTLDEKLDGQRMIVLCSYPLSSSSAAEIFDVVNTHQLAIVRRRGEWEVVETSELKQAKAEIKRLNEGLERRVVERTRELEATNERLRGEIVERRRAEEALRVTNSKLELIVDTSPLPITSADAGGRITSWNKAAERLFGWTEEEAVGGVCPTIPPEEAEDYLGMIRKVMQGETHLGLVHYRQKKGGDLLYCSVSAAPQRNGRGEPVGVTIIVEDITERKRAEEALRESETKLKEAQRIAKIGYWERDLLDDRITLSEETAAIFGLSRRVFTQAELQEMTHPDDRERKERALQDALEGKRRYDYEYRIVLPDGEVRFVHAWDEIAYDESGRPVRMFGTVQDITERKLAEEQLKRSNEELRALSGRLHSVREEESARIAREIHDELGGALSSLKWDLEEVGEIISESADASQLTALREKVGGMITLTDATVDAVRRIASELRPTALEEFGLVEALRWHAQQFQARTGITVHCDCPPESVGLSREQATAVFRIVQEALTNVLRHSGATRVDIKIRHEGGHYVVTVSDNGRGITEAEKAGPRSLGLLGMRERAYLLGGEINVEGVEGRGTVVTLRVPALDYGSGRKPPPVREGTLTA